jgi:hypothetical protein
LNVAKEEKRKSLFHSVGALRTQNESNRNETKRNNYQKKSDDDDDDDDDDILN